MLILPSNCYIFSCKFDVIIWCYVKINFKVMSLSILLNCLLDDIQILQGEVACWSLLGVKGLKLPPTVQMIKQWLSFLSFHLPFRIPLKTSGSICLGVLCFSWTPLQNSLAASTMSPFPSCSDSKLIHTCVGATKKNSNTIVTNSLIE